MRKKQKNRALHNVTLSAKKLTSKRTAILAALVAGETVTAISERLRISRMSVYRAIRDRGFQEAFREAKDQSFDAAKTWLSNASTRAVGELVGLLECPDPAIRRSAAVAILDRAFKVWELVDLENKIAELEAIVAAAAPPSKAGPEGL